MSIELALRPVAGGAPASKDPTVLAIVGWVGVGVGVGVGVVVGVGGLAASGFAGFGPGQPVRRRAKMAASRTRIPNCGGESVPMKVAIWQTRRSHSSAALLRVAMLDRLPVGLDPPFHKLCHVNG